MDKVDKLTEEKSKFESDRYLVEKVARHYQLIKYISKDSKNKDLPDNYNYDDKSGANHNRHKYIATAVEAMIGAIYKETNDLKSIIELLDSWRKF